MFKIFFPSHLHLVFSCCFKLFVRPTADPCCDSPVRVLSLLHHLLFMLLTHSLFTHPSTPFLTHLRSRLRAGALTFPYSFIYNPLTYFALLSRLGQLVADGLADPDTYLHSLALSYIRSRIHSLTHLLARSFIQSLLTHSHTRLLLTVFVTCSLSRSLTHTHSYLLLLIPHSLPHTDSL